MYVETRGLDRPLLDSARRRGWHRSAPSLAVATLVWGFVIADDASDPALRATWRDDGGHTVEGPARGGADLALLRSVYADLLTCRDDGRDLRFVGSACYSDAAANDVALRILEEAAERWPDDVVTTSDLGWTYFRAGRIDRGLGSLARAVNMARSAPSPWRQFAEARLDDALRDHPMLLRHPSCADGFCAAPRRRIGDELGNGDATSLDGASSGEPATPARLGGLAFGALYASPPRLAEAAKLYREAIAANDRLAPGDEDRLEGDALAGLWEGVGIAELLAGRCEEAAEAFGTAALLQPGGSPFVAESQYNLACALARCRRYDEAVAALRKAAESDGSYRDRATGDEDLAPLRSHAGFRALIGRRP